MDSEFLCLVCSTKNVQTHFGLSICKSCSSFYRRSLTSERTFRCKLNTSNCDLSIGKNLCRACRFEKLKDLKISAIEVKRSTENSGTKSDNHASSSAEINNIPDLNRNFDKLEVICNIKPSIPKINAIFLEKGPSKEIKSTTVLQTIIDAFDNFQKRMPVRKKEDLRIDKYYDIIGCIDYYQRFIIHAAHMLMELPQFSAIDLQEKWQYFKHFHQTFFGLVKLYNTFEVFGYDESETIWMATDTAAHRVEPLVLLGEQFTPDISDQLCELMYPIVLYEEEFVLGPMKKLKLDKMDIAWLIAQVLFTRKNMHNIKIETSIYHERVLKIACNELNNYYFLQKQEEDYCWRISEMIKLLDKIKQSNDRKKEAFMIARILSILQYDLMESELIAVYK